jgi:hypothetical protein
MFEFSKFEKLENDFLKVLTQRILFYKTIEFGLNPFGFINQKIYKFSVLEKVLNKKK